MIPNRLLLIVLLFWTTTGSGQERRGHSSRKMETLPVSGDLPIMVQSNTVDGYDYIYPGSRRAYGKRKNQSRQDNDKGGIPMTIVPNTEGGYSIIYYPPPISDCGKVESFGASRYKSTQTSKPSKPRSTYRPSN